MQVQYQNQSPKHPPHNLMTASGPLCRLWSCSCSSIHVPSGMCCTIPPQAEMPRSKRYPEGISHEPAPSKEQGLYVEEIAECGLLDLWFQP